MAANKRNPIDFSTASPPLAVTNPDAFDRVQQGLPPVDARYPLHMVKPDLDGPGGPANRELVEAQNAADEKRYTAQGFMSHQDADAAERKAQGKGAAKAPKKKAIKPVAAKKPANRKPPAPKPE